MKKEWLLSKFPVSDGVQRNCGPPICGAPRCHSELFLAMQEKKKGHLKVTLRQIASGRRTAKKVTFLGTAPGLRLSYVAQLPFWKDASQRGTFLGTAPRLSLFDKDVTSDVTATTRTTTNPPKSGRGAT